MASSSYYNTKFLYSFPLPSITSPHFSQQQQRQILSATKNHTPFSLTSTPSQNPNSTQIFLPYLLQQETEDDFDQESQNPSSGTGKRPDPDEKVGNLAVAEDPILGFFKSRSGSPVPDPSPEGRVTLQSNRRTSWHLAPSFNELVEPEFENPVSVPGTVSETVPGTVSELNTVPGHKLDSTLVSRTRPDPGPEGVVTVELERQNENSVVSEIVGLARSLPVNMTLGEVLGPYEGKVGEKDCVEVLGLMGEEGLMMGCLYFFEWMGLQVPSLVTARACSVLFPALGRNGMGDRLMVLFSNLPNEVQFKDVRVYNAAISGLLCCGRYDDAWRVFETMDTKNVKPDHVTCSIMITVMRKEGRSAKDAWEFFESLNKKGVMWSLEAVGALIKCFCDEGLKKEALIIQLEMEKKGISSNVIVYNTIMDAYVKSDQVEEAEGLFAEMKAKGIAPTSASYNILMDAYSRRMQPEIIEKLILEMEDVGLEPNVKSFTCLISAYGRQKKMSDMAADAFLRLKRVGIKPTSHSYTALIHAYSVDKWHEKAYMAFENMLREGIKPSIETYTALLDACRRAGDTETLMTIWKLMINDKVEGTRVTFNILLDGFAKQGHYVEARDVVGEFMKIGLQPTVMTYNMLINAYARGGQESKLPQLLKEMAARNLKPDSITYSTMIYAYVRVRDFKRAFFYHKQMVKSGQVPDAKSYQKLRAILDVKAATKNRKDKSAILGIINSKFGLPKIKKKGKKDEFWKNKIKRPRTGVSNSVRLE